MTQQPVWKFLKNLGDDNPLDYGGLFVFVDETGVYPPEMERAEPVSEDDEADLTIHRVVLDRCTYVNGILSDNQFHPEMPSWFAEIANEDLIEQLCSDDPIERAFGYQIVLDHFGWDNGDSYPRTISYGEAEKRYEEILEEGT